MRTYIVFGSEDNESFKRLGQVEANTHDQAQTQARELEDGWPHYASTTVRNWSVRTPTVKTVVSWSDVTPGQMTVDDVLDTADDLIGRAEAAAAREKAKAS